MATGVLITANDRSTPQSTILTLFGNPNDYTQSSANTGALGYWKGLTTPVYDTFHAVAIDSHSRTVLYSNNVFGAIELESIYFNASQLFIEAPPISKRVNVIFVSLSCVLFTARTCT